MDYLVKDEDAVYVTVSEEFKAERVELCKHSAYFTPVDWVSDHKCDDFLVRYIARNQFGFIAQSSGGDYRVYKSKSGAENLAKKLNSEV
jgi:hypothetical protein